MKKKKKSKKLGLPVSKEKNKVIYQFFPIETSSEIERQNRHIRQMKSLSNKDFVINLLEKIINQQKNNKLTLNRNSIKLSFYNLGIENDYDDNAKALYFLGVFKQQGRIEDYSYNGAVYTIVKPDIKKLQKYINDFKKGDDNAVDDEAKTESKHNIGSRINSNIYSVNISGFGKLEFKNKRADIIDFFDRAENPNTWQTYQDIKRKIGDCDTAFIRKAIKSINKRFANYTNNKFLELIEANAPQAGSGKSTQYRLKNINL